MLENVDSFLTITKEKKMTDDTTKLSTYELFAQPIAQKCNGPTLNFIGKTSIVLHIGFETKGGP